MKRGKESELLELKNSIGNSPVLSRLLDNGFVLQQKLSLATCCVLIAASAWILGQLAWFIEPAEQTVVPWKATASSSSAPQSTLDISSLQKSNLLVPITQLRLQWLSNK